LTYTSGIRESYHLRLIAKYRTGAAQNFTTTRDHRCFPVVDQPASIGSAGLSCRARSASGNHRRASFFSRVRRWPAMNWRVRDSRN